MEKRHFLELLQRMQMTSSENEPNLIFFDWRSEGFCAAIFGELGSKWGDQKNQWCNMVRQQNVFVKVDLKSIGRCQRYIASFLVCNLFSTNSSKCVLEASKNMLMIWCFLDAWRAILMEFQHEKSVFWHCREKVYKKPGRNHGCINFCISASTKKVLSTLLPTNPSNNFIYIHHIAWPKCPWADPAIRWYGTPCHAACGHARTWDLWQTWSHS